jgi:acyl-coenzyme A thioesterase PaaI-like protein
MTEPTIQESYPDDLSQCYGCGRLNEHGLHLESRIDGDEAVALFTPEPHHLAIPGYVYGGLLASLVDCHSMATAAAAANRLEGRDTDAEPGYRFVTAKLEVSYERPTPTGVPLEIRGRVAEIKGRKVVVDATVSAGGDVCVRGRVVAVQIPDSMRPGGTGRD